MATVDTNNSGEVLNPPAGPDDNLAAGVGGADQISEPLVLEEDEPPRRFGPTVLVGLIALAGVVGAVLFALDRSGSDQSADPAGPGAGQVGAAIDATGEVSGDGETPTIDVVVDEDEDPAVQQVGEASTAEADDATGDTAQDNGPDADGDTGNSTAPDTVPPAELQTAADIPISVLGMSSLSNVPLRTNRAAYRFTADRTGEVDSIRLYYIVNTTRAGYANGTGGTVAMTMAPDDGTGLPDEANRFAGRVEATFGLSGGAPTGDRSTYVRDTLFRRWVFSEPIPVEAGRDYHVIFENVDPDPTNNYVSLDLVIDLLPDALRGGDPIPSPAARSDFGFVQSSGDGWRLADSHREGHRQTPIFEVTYTDGNTLGQGFMQYEARATFSLTGTSAIRTTITVPEDRTISELAARVGAQAGGAVILELTTLDGEVLRSVDAPTDATANYRNAVWAQGTVEPFTLVAGTPYALVVRAAPGYTGDVVPLQAGVNYGFAAKSVFPFGVAQTSPDGTSWTDWRNGLFYQSISVR